MRPACHRRKSGLRPLFFFESARGGACCCVRAQWSKKNQDSKGERRAWSLALPEIMKTGNQQGCVCVLTRKRSKQRDRLVSVDPIMLKIGVCGADGSCAVYFGESRHAGIREIHWRIVEALHHFLDMDQLFCQRRDSKSTFHYEINDLCCCDSVSCHQMANLGQDRLANDFAALYFFKNPGGPCVESIPRAKPRYQWSGVENDRLHSPRSSRCDLLVERSVYLPCPMPLKWRSRSASEGRDASAFSDVPSTIVSNARALGGNTSNPRGRTRPSSRSTSKVWNVIRKTYGDQTKPQVQAS
jgi:hypothetical protein